GAPDHAAVGALDEVGQVVPARPLAHADGEVLRTAQVGAPRFEAVVGRMPRAAELEVVRGLGKRVAVEDRLEPAVLQRAVPRQAADLLVLAALAELPTIGERP